jgi:hypothetical protein
MAMAEVGALNRLIAVEDIKNMKARYFRYVDEKDWSAFRSVFCSDAHFEVFFGTIEGADEFVSLVQDYLKDGLSIHQGHMPEIEILSETEATGVWTLFDHIEVSDSRFRPSFYGYGRYWEKYRREDDEWRISSMRMQRLREIMLPS